MTPDGVGHACSQLTQQRAEKNRSAGAGDAHSPAVSSPTVRGGRCRGARMTTHATPARGARCSVTGNFNDQQPRRRPVVRPVAVATTAVQMPRLRIPPPWLSASATPLRHRSGTAPPHAPCRRLFSTSLFNVLHVLPPGDQSPPPVLHQFARRASQAAARRAISVWRSASGGASVWSERAERERARKHGGDGARR